MSFPDRIIHFTGIFSLSFPVWKINTLSSPASLQPAAVCRRGRERYNGTLMDHTRGTGLGLDSDGR